MERRKRYSIIYADPPWAYHNGNKKGTRLNGVAINHYDTMEYKDIGALPIGELAEENCILFMWATFPLLAEALEVIKAWGFIYKTVAFSWVKTKQKTEGWDTWGNEVENSITL